MNDQPEIVERVCPNCGCEITTLRYEPHETSAGCDTSVDACNECDWRGDPE